MVVAAANAAAYGRSNDHLRRILAARSVAVLRKLVHDLVVGRPNEIGELNFRYGHETVERHADRTTNDAPLTERSVDHTVFAELVEESLGDAEDASDFSDVFSENHDALVAPHFDAKRVVDRLDHVHL